MVELVADFQNLPAGLSMTIILAMNLMTMTWHGRYSFEAGFAVVRLAPSILLVLSVVALLVFVVSVANL